MIKQIQPSTVKYIKTKEELLECATLIDECVWSGNGEGEEVSIPDYIKEEEVLFVSQEMTFGEIYLETKQIEVDGVIVKQTNSDEKVKSAFGGDSVSFLKKIIHCVKDEELGYKEVSSDTILYVYN